jgi:hypothetical protein
VALALRHQLRREDLAPVHHPHQVDAHEPAPVALGVGEWVSAGVDAGVVADEVDAPELAQRALEQRLDGGALRDVGVHGQRTHPALAQLGAGLLGGGEVDVGHDDLHPLPRQRAADPPADPARAPRHHGHPAPELPHACPLPLVPGAILREPKRAGGAD